MTVLLCLQPDNGGSTVTTDGATSHPRRHSGRGMLRREVKIWPLIWIVIRRLEVARSLGSGAERTWASSVNTASSQGRQRAKRSIQRVDELKAGVFGVTSSTGDLLHLFPRRRRPIEKRLF